VESSCEFGIAPSGSKKMLGNSSIIRIIKSRRMRWARHVARMVGEEERI
jgi:hypothetical protein